MSKNSFRKLTLAVALTVLAATKLHAQASTTTPPPPPPPPIPGTVTGTDPEPTSPNVVDIILTILHLA